nr:hypothetical protein ORM20_00230 [Ochrobactrum phage ORM_20]
MIVLQRPADGSFYAKPGCITWFSRNPSDAKVYESKDSWRYLRDLKIIDRSKMYRGTVKTVKAPDEVLKLKPIIY